VRVRIGMHTGRPTLTDTGYVGIAVHIAARICYASHGGQIFSRRPPASPSPNVSSQALPSGGWAGSHFTASLSRRRSSGQRRRLAREISSTPHDWTNAQFAIGTELARSNEVVRLSFEQRSSTM